MRVALLLVVLAAQDGLREAVEKGARALAADGVEERDEAAARLVKLGAPALGLLRAARDGSEDPEVRARVVDVIRRIECDVRRATFEGGDAVCGLRAGLRLATEKKTIKAGENVTVTLEIMNVSTHRADLAPVKTWSWDLPEECFYVEWAEACVIVTQLSGERPERNVAAK